MGDIAIRVEGIGKQYRMGKAEKYKTLRDTLASGFTAPFRAVGRLLGGGEANEAGLDEQFWALKEVSFEVKQGEVIGVIGGNGAGKSTLLKILSRITEPTTGFAEIHGRVGSLLEVGTGFHPELTGRENTYLNGAILGMTRKEIAKKFDEIVAFSEVDKFIDTPVKHYSSGMYLRLAFAVAAHLEPEILIIDEVLAVGDAGFQRKCLGKMGAVAKEGRTVLFVSHNMGAITQLCETAVQLEKGKLKRSGTATEVVDAYLSSVVGTELKSSWLPETAESNDSEVRFRSARLLSGDERPVSVTNFNQSLLVEITYEVKCPIRNLSVTCQIYDSMNHLVFESMDTDMPEWNGRVREPDVYRATAKTPPCLLKPGRYQVSFSAFIEGVRVITRLNRVLAFDVTGIGCTLQPKRSGIVSPVIDWKIRRFSENGRVA
ncbi:MAG: ABC transporter ATP-binding protein [Nitrospira sp.]|nr:ABC transporter ATP-binding protein [Nitrospira sp.]